MDADPASSAGTALAITAAMALVAANGLFVAAEFALVRVRPARLAELQKSGKRGARHARHLVDHLDEALSVCQVGITLASLALGFVGEEAFAHLFSGLFETFGAASAALTRTLSIGAAFLIVTVLHVVLGELVPKSMAIAVAEPMALATALPLRAFWIVSWPLVWLLNSMARLVLAPFAIGDAAEPEAHGREEIRQLMLRSVKRGRIGTIEAHLVDNLFRFATRRAGEIMVPRAAVTVIDASAGPAECRRIMREEGYSRYPLVDGDLDRLVGIVHVKNVMAALDDESDPLDVRAVARPPLVVPESMPVDRLLRAFQNSRLHMAIVADEYGGVAGVVTLEDVLEELVGELRDEFDDEERDPVRERPGGGLVLDPHLPLDRALELTDDPPQIPEGVRTVSGYFQHTLGRLPRAGDRVPLGSRHDLVAAAVRGVQLVRVEMVDRDGAD